MLFDHCFNGANAEATIAHMGKHIDMVEVLPEPSVQDYVSE
jgi:hypothetical protein